jgi:hypothetical protein
MIVTMAKWETIRHLFSEEEKLALNAANVSRDHVVPSAVFQCRVPPRVCMSGRPGPDLLSLT